MTLRLMTRRNAIMSGRTNRIITAAIVVCASCAGGVLAEEKNVTGTIADAVSWLEKESHRIIRASKREMKDGTSAFPPQVGIHYEAFWLRDYEYTLDLSDPRLADRTILDMVSHFKKHGACEWIIGEKRNLPHYLASAALPLDGIRAMLDRRQRSSDQNKPNK